MGVIFLKSESRQFISDCQSNIQNGQDVIQDLKSGCAHLMQAVDGKRLSGAAYTAGKGLFGDLIVPVITRFGQAIQTASTNKLDEDKLTQQIRECEAYRQTVKLTADALNSQAFEILAMSNPVTAMVALADQLFDIRGKLNAYLTSLDQDIDKLKNDLRLLQNFVSQTQGLFRDSTSRIKLAMQGISVLGKMKVNADGRYRFPKGMDERWFSQLQKNVTAVEDNTLSNAYLTLYKQIEDLLSPLKKGKTDNIKRIEMLLKTYPANVVKKLLGNDEFWLLANKLPSGIQTKLINGLSKYETFGQVIAQGKWLPKIDTLGKAYESFDKFSSPVKTFVSESLKNAKWLKGAKEFGVAKGLGSIAKVATYAQLGIVWWMILFVPFVFWVATNSDTLELVCKLLLLCFVLFGMVAKVMIVFSQQLILYYHIDFEKWLSFEHYRYHKKKSAKYLVSLQVSEAKVAYYKGEFRESIDYIQDINEKALSRFIYSYQCSVKEVLCKSAIMLGDKAQSEAILSQLTLELDQNNSQTKKNKLKNILALGHSIENIVLDKVPNDDIISWQPSTDYKLERLEKSYYQTLNEQLKGNTDKAKADFEAISKESSELFFVRESKQYLEDHR